MSYVGNSMYVIIHHTHSLWPCRCSGVLWNFEIILPQVRKAAVKQLLLLLLFVCFCSYWWQRRHVTFQPVQNKCLVLRPMQMKGTGWRWWNCSGMSCHSLISQYYQAFLSTPKCQGDERKFIQTNDKEMNVHSSDGTCGQGNIPYILPRQKSCSLRIWENNDT